MVIIFKAKIPFIILKIIFIFNNSNNHKKENNKLSWLEKVICKLK